MTLFNFGRYNHVSISRVVSDDDYGKVVGLWINGRIFGHYLRIPMIPWRGRL